MHAIRDCEEVQSFWYDMTHPDQISHFFSIGLDGWLHLNLSSSEVGQTSTDWRIFFGIAVYELWCDRNRLVFVGSTALSQGLRFFTEKQARFVVLHHISQSRVSPMATRQQVGISWVPPPDGCYKVNIDGSHSSVGGSACGGLVRRSNRSFVQGFFCKLGSGNAFWAELWGLRLGLNLARQLGLSWVIFELDLKVVVDMIHSGGSSLAYLNPLMQEITSLLRDPGWRVSVQHVYHEANRGADFLAKQGHSATSFD